MNNDVLKKLLIAAAVTSSMAMTSMAWAGDADNDGVNDAIDLCPNTTIPEQVPERHLGYQHFALTNDDTTFNRLSGESSFTLEDTGGCSCEQIIELSGEGPLSLQSNYGCRINTMRTFAGAVTAVPVRGISPVVLTDGTTTQATVTFELHGTLANDLTWFVFEAEAGDMIDIDINRLVAGSDLHARLYRGDVTGVDFYLIPSDNFSNGVHGLFGFEIIAYEYDTDGEGGDPRFTLQITETGTYSIIVSDTEYVTSSDVEIITSISQ